MVRSIKLSRKAERKLSLLLDYLERKWSIKAKNDFILKLDKSLNKIRQFPESFPDSESIRGLHKCVITRQTTIYYKFDDSKILIVTLFDNRQDPEKLIQETK